MQIAEALDRQIAERIHNDPPRGHLGMSVIGKDDARELWLKFRWCIGNDHEPRAQRIFDLGHVIEDEVIRLLRTLPGVVIHDRNPSTGEQFNFTELGGHFAGSMDACGKGFPIEEAEKVWHVIEVKSVKASKFKELQKKGVKKWNAAYYGQMQCYMGASSMTAALFVAYCKDNSEIYFEVVKPEAMYYPGAIEKARRIIEADAPPESSFPNEAWYEARFMPFETAEVYWGRRLPRSANCRNCRHSRPITDEQGAIWYCDHISSTLNYQGQIHGCSGHRWLPALVPSNEVEYDPATNTALYESADGVRFYNGDAGDPKRIEQPFVYSSKELAELSKVGFASDVLCDPAYLRLTEKFGATIDNITPVGGHMTNVYEGGE